jgi:hypothetical protein
MGQGVTVQTFAFGGGLDTNSAGLAVNPSALIYGNNYEPLAEGYGRVDGYERCDGRTAPSAAEYYGLSFTSGTAAFVAADTITGLTSGATGIVIGSPAISSGAYGTSDAVGMVAIVATSGTFQAAEALRVGGVTRATCSGAAVLLDAPDDDQQTTWHEATEAYFRALIGVVPGEGDVRGVAIHNGSVYAWRDNVGATKLLGYKASAAGWVALTESYRIAFTTGLAASIVDGASIVGGTSAATATVVRVVVTSGSFAAGNAAGWLHVTGVTGTFQAAEFIKVGGTNRATCSGAQTANTFTAGGRVRTKSHNFYGASSRYRLYGVTTTSYGFELVSDVMCPIFTGMTTDKPLRMFVMAQHLFFTFAGGSLQFAAAGEPHVWSPILGAGEIGLGTEVTDAVQSNDTATAIFGEQKVAILTGTGSSDFSLNVLTEEAGCDADSAQRIARTVYVDKRGLRSLDATQAFGDFSTGTLSGQFEAYFKSKRRALATVRGSIISRTKSHYRLFWSDGTGLAVYMGTKIPQAIPFDYAYTPTCFAEGDLSDGEALLVGCTDGYVRRLDSGTNFDGTAITAVCMTPFNHFKSPMQDKRFRKVTLELQGSPLSTISITAQFDYGDINQPIDDGQTISVRGSGGFWDISSWNEFYWDDPFEGTGEVYIDGQGRNASFVLANTSALTETRHILQAYSVHFSPRKMKR